MKSLSIVLLASLWFTSLNAQEIVSKWDVSIPESAAESNPTAAVIKPEPIDFAVLHTHTQQKNVVEAPEMHGLPPIVGPIHVTVQLVEDPDLSDPTPPLPNLPPDDPAVLVRLAELRKKYRSTRLVFLSATVYDHKRTLLHIYPNGKREDSVTAWSNLDFNHFSGFATFQVKDGVDGSLHDYGLLMGIGNVTTKREGEKTIRHQRSEEPDTIPSLRDITDGGADFVVVKGSEKSSAMHTLEQIHDLYRREEAKMKGAYLARESARAERKAYLLLNPPKPKDVTIRFWKRATPSPAGSENLKQEIQP